MDQHRRLSASEVQLLAVESASAHLSVALSRGEELLALASPQEQEPGHHAERILPLIDEVLRSAGVAEAEIDVFGVSIGPGSFTSLRVGLATVKGLAFGTSRPIVPVPTLAVVARGYLRRNAAGGPPLAVLLDARRGEAYAAVFDVGGEEPQTLLPDGLFTPVELAPKLPVRCTLVGEGAPIFGEELRRLAGPGIEVTAGTDVPSADDVGWLARRALARGLEAGAPDLAPRYVRRAEAEVTRTSLRVE